MTLAEAYFRQNIKDILKYGAKDLNPRPKYKDGTPAHTLFITDVFEKYSPTEVPITETRPIAWKTAIRELLWIYQDQSTSLTQLEARNVKYWRDWEIEGTDSIGNVYGQTVSNYDLINNLIHGLETDPFGRRHIINLWQEHDFKQPHGLKPCAFLSMFSVRPLANKELALDSSLTIRSSDYLTAGHINRMQYRALQLMLAKHLGMKVGTFSVHTKNLHIYDRHFEQAYKILETFDKLERGKEIEFYLDVPDGTDFYDITDSDFKLVGYKPFKHNPKLEFELGI